MSTYYEYKDVKVMIAHKLMAMDGWKVYGYHSDNSDPMTDYYDPASWGGVAEKNGYILCVDVHGASEPQNIYKFNNDGLAYDRNIMDKIEKLSQMTVERGASEQEEESAKMMIARLQEKSQKSTEEKYIVTGVIPGHMANPPRMNWHIEKDGVYIIKGNGILKYAHLYNYYTYPHYIEDMKKFRTMSREEYLKVNNYIKSLGGYYSKFKHAFLFTENPMDKLNVDKSEEPTEPVEEEQTETAQETTEELEKEPVNYTITEDQHTKTGAKIWIVKPDKELNKTDFAEVKRKLAALHGYYNTFKHGFIFKYNPEEALQTG